jgi:large subunit ribosomal protein L10
MDREEKERVIAELTARLRESEALIVTDYRGLTMPQIDGLRGTLLEHGASFSVVKNTLTRRAAEEAGVEALFAMLEGPSAIAFIESEGNVVEVARALQDSVRQTRVLVVRGGLMQGRTISGADVEELSKLPPFDILRGQVLGAITAPLGNFLSLISAPLQNLIGLIDARIEQLGGAGEAEAASEPATGDAPSGDEPAAAEEPAADEQPSDEPSASVEASVSEPTDEAEQAEPAASAEADTQSGNQEVDEDGGS